MKNVLSRVSKSKTDVTQRLFLVPGVLRRMRSAHTLAEELEHWEKFQLFGGIYE